MRLVLFLLVALLGMSFGKWGFYGHKLITRKAIYTLPTELSGFYKSRTEIIVAKSVVPDQRRYVILEEGPRHYIDLDDYDNPDSIPKYWSKAVAKYGEEFLQLHGIGPWYTYRTYQQLVKAMARRDEQAIIRLSADLAHYIADANVPLHTTSNYNGQQTNQHGIHGFWETRLPQLYSDGYNFLVGRAEYLEDPQGRIWQVVFAAHSMVDSVLLVEIEITKQVGEQNKFAYEDFGKSTRKTYSQKFSKKYHEAMPSVEERMQASVKMIGDFWFTAWIEAGQPDLTVLEGQIAKSDSTELQPTITPLRPHDF